MARSPSPELRLSTGEAGELLDLADGAIVEGLLGDRPSSPPEAQLPPALRERTGLFVTLTVCEELNGCIGNVEGEEPLGQAAVRNAWSAAFADPRLPALRPVDYEELTIEVSVLSALVEMPVRSRGELLGELRPGVDGLVIGDRSRRGVFLPAVWEQLPEPTAFLDHLEAKAGMRPGSWDGGMRAWRFTAAKYRRRAGRRSSPFEAA